MPEPKVPQPSPTAVDLSTDPEEATGMLWKDVVTVGNPANPAMSGDTAFVHYTGTLASDGSKFDSSRDRGQPFKFQLGKGEVIRGWDVGVLSMCVGERATLTVCSDWAYGDNGSPPKIPGGATLVFDVEVLRVEGEDVTTAKDGGVRKRVRGQGEGLDHPNDGSAVVVDVKGSVGDRVFDERKDVEFTLGEGCEFGVPR